MWFSPKIRISPALIDGMDGGISDKVLRFSFSFEMRLVLDPFAPLLATEIMNFRRASSELTRGCLTSLP